MRLFDLCIVVVIPNSYSYLTSKGSFDNYINGHVHERTTMERILEQLY